ncbi:MAG: 3-phosphoserine/phosphohydroxythreonine aminotransferase [Deltaproteobacteria bacterium]|nr:3-phosphoserine/phosphohydroxythreonine aminotransferase [Deltaproteobacteria bacterium]
MTQRVHNFSAGPSALPLAVLEAARRDLSDFNGTGMSIMEMSHRSQTYDEVHNQAIADLKALMGMDDSWDVLFMGGGARTQFALLPMNLLPEDGLGTYITTGKWSEGALSEANKIGHAEELWTSKETGHDRVPAPGEVAPKASSTYLHYTSNNTIYGTQFHHTPDSGDALLLCDMSSDILSRQVEVDKFSVIYAGAQKNMGPAGVTVVFLRRDLLEHSPADLPETMSYQKMGSKNSLLNTPPVFPIYMVGLVARHLVEQGGLDTIAAANVQKAELLYRAIDNSGGFYRGHAQPDSRSRMNVTFRLPDEELESAFLSESGELGMNGLKGHRSVGGLRASIYNAVPLDAVTALVDFMDDFKRRRG